MPELKTITDTVVDSFEWDRFVKQVYDRPYTFQQQDGCRQRGVSYFTATPGQYEFVEHMEPVPTGPIEGIRSCFGVSLEEWVGRSPEAAFDPDRPNRTGTYWERNYYPPIDELASDLCEKGLIAPGRYVLLVDW